MQYLRNAQSDFDPFFFYLFVFNSSVTYVKTEKMVFTPPPPLALSLLSRVTPRNFTVLDRAMVLPPTLMGRIVQFLFQVNMTILVLSALMLSPLVSHHFSIVLMIFCVRCQMTPVSLPSASVIRSSANAWR